MNPPHSGHRQLIYCPRMSNSAVKNSTCHSRVLLLVATAQSRFSNHPAANSSRFAWAHTADNAASRLGTRCCARSLPSDNFKTSRPLSSADVSSCSVSYYIQPTASQCSSSANQAPTWNTQCYCDLPQSQCYQIQAWQSLPLPNSVEDLYYPQKN